MSQAVPVLMYHHVSPNPGLVTVSPETFARQIQYLAEAGFTALSADRFFAFLQGRESVPSKSVLITFDDGYLDNYVYAYPVLERHGMRATIFAVTSWITDGPVRGHAGETGASSLPPTPDHRGCKAAIAAGRADEVMLRWSEILKMESSGAIEIHSHTHTHVRWDEVHADSTKRLAVLQEDLQLSKETLRQQLGKDSRHLCWPWGYFEREYLAAAEQAGFPVLYTVAKGVNAVGADPQQIARIVIKDRVGRWFANRMWIYRHGLAGRIYSRLRGD